MNILHKTLTKTLKSKTIFPSSIPIHLFKKLPLSSLYSSWCSQPLSNYPKFKPLSPMEEKQKAQNSIDEIEKKKLSKPSKIPFQVKAANLVNILGTVKMPIQFCDDYVNGKFWAATVIAPQRHPYVTKSNLWIPIIFEGDLAHIAATHLKEDDYVYVAGHFSPHSPPIKLTEEQVKLKVMVHDVCYVRQYAGKMDDYRR